MYAREGDSFFVLDVLVSGFRHDTFENGAEGVAKTGVSELSFK